MLFTMQKILFGDLPLHFFRPLSGSLASVYGAVLRRLYELDFEGEPFEITHETAIEQSALLIEQSAEFGFGADEFRQKLNDEEGGAEECLPELNSKSDEREARQLARHILRRLERCGWFDYEYREQRGGYILNFRDYAARVLHVLVQIAKQEQPLFEGLAQSIKAALGPQELSENSGVALYNARSATKDLVREIKILSRNIHRYADRALKDSKSSQELLELQLEIYQKKVVHSSYHRFKTSDNIFRYRSFILKQLRQFEERPEIFEQAVEWIKETQNQTRSISVEIVQDWIDMIRNQLSSIHLLTEDLDRKNARYSSTTLQRISYLLNQDHLIQNRLVRLLNDIQLATESGVDFGGPEFAAFNIRSWDANSLYRPPKETVEMKVEGVVPTKVSEECRRRVLEKARQSVDSQFSKRRVYAMVHDFLAGRNKVPLKDIILATSTQADFLKLIFISYHGFDRKAPYKIELESDWKNKVHEIGNFQFHEGELKRRENMEIRLEREL